ncbi:hypothetical protein BDV06DRAFT_210390 [Aspergillus oleicola]
MAASTPSDAPRALREGRTRLRSRFGCRNCKLRKVKCDESKPQCKRCRSFGVLCNFMSNIPDLQPVATGSDKGRPLVVRPRVKAGGGPRLQRPLAASIWTSDSSYHYQLNTRCQDFVTRYLGRSLVTPNDPEMIQVNLKLLELAFTHPFLMHASLAVAFTYDRHLNITDTLSNRRTIEECYHWSQATALLNKQLRMPIEAKDKDPIWGTAAFLVILTFSSPDARTWEQAWPLNSSRYSSDSGSDSESELDWLRMSSGKMALWQLVDPLRPDSLFHVMASTFATMLSPFPESGIDGIPPGLATLCHLEHSSIASTNPYFHAAHALSAILRLPDIEVGTGEAYLFMRIIQDPGPSSFRNLLLSKDPVALLLLYLWYSKVGRAIWWVELRARVEAPAIGLYLRRYHADDKALMAFLEGVF